MSAAPPPPGGVPWASSLKFKAYLGSWFLLVVGWLTENLTTHQLDFKTWTWIAFAVSTLTLCGAVVRDWMNPSVAAPFSYMNQSNTQTVSAASIRAADKNP